jgi:hypothetical protein
MNSKLSAAVDRLDELGVKQAPLRRAETPGAGGVPARYVTLRDPPGVYYIAHKNEPKIQLLFLAVPSMADHFASLIDAKIVETELLRGSTEKIPVHSVILRIP